MSCGSRLETTCFFLCNLLGYPCCIEGLKTAARQWQDTRVSTLSGPCRVCLGLLAWAMQQQTLQTVCKLWNHRRRNIANLGLQSIVFLKPFGADQSNVIKQIPRIMQVHTGATTPSLSKSGHFMSLHCFDCFNCFNLLRSFAYLSILGRVLALEKENNNPSVRGSLSWSLLTLLAVGVIPCWHHRWGRKSLRHSPPSPRQRDGRDAPPFWQLRLHVRTSKIEKNIYCCENGKFVGIQLQPF